MSNPISWTWKTGEIIKGHPNFLLVISYNPGYQSVLKDLKQSTRQRFVSMAFDYPAPEDEATIVENEGSIDRHWVKTFPYTKSGIAMPMTIATTMYGSMKQDSQNWKTIFTKKT